jgi:hypothetical protein
MVYFTTTASFAVEVEAEDALEAEEEAYDTTNFPDVNIYNGFDLGDWEVASHLDVVLIEE